MNIFSLSCLWILSACLTAAQADEPKKEKPPEEPFAGEIAAFEKIDGPSPEQGGIMFTGSSSFRLWDTAKAFPDVKIINRGFGGSTMKDLRRYTARIIIPRAPHVIFIYEGDNDINKGVSEDDYLAECRGFVEDVRKQLPKTVIVFLAIKPSPSRWHLWPKVSTCNARLKLWCDEDPLLEYLDIAAPLLQEDGTPDPSCYRDDKLHLNEEGYARWKKVFEPVLQKYSLAS